MIRPLAPCVLALALLATSLGQPGAATAQAQAAPFCDDGQSPAFVFGFADLKAVLGDLMGDPVECEHANSANGDTLQQTTTGLAIYRQATNTPEFTDGWKHWALTAQGIVAWSGSDTPAVGTQQPLPSVPAHLDNACVDIGAGLCVDAAAALDETVTLLAKTSVAQPLLRNAAREAYSIRYGDLPPDVLGLFRPSRHEVVISADLQSYPATDRGPVLAHELQHVADWISQGDQLNTLSGCLATESNAFDTESAVWLELRGGRLMPPANDLEQEFNTITRAIETNPTAFANRLTLLYHDECTAQ